MKNATRFENPMPIKVSTFIRLKSARACFGAAYFEACAWGLARNSSTSWDACQKNK